MPAISEKTYIQGFIPYILGALLIGIVGGFTTMLGPAVVVDFDIAYNNTTWTTLAMAVSSASLAPIMGKLCDAIGRRRTLLFGLLIFTVGNFLTAIGNNLPFMLIARFTVGAGTAAVAPVVMSYIVTEFPKDSIEKGFSVYMLVSSSAVVFGPTLGGMMINSLGWRAMMWVCVAICITIFLICFVITRGDSTKRGSLSGIDGWGSLFVFLFFGLVLCIPSFGQNFGWTSNSFLLVLLGSAIALIGLVLIERNAENPILIGRFLRRKTFILSILALFLTQGLMQANMTNTIVFVNYTQPENTIISSYAISIMYLGMSLGSVFIGPLADKHEPKSVLTGSFIITAFGCAVMLFLSADSSALLLAGGLGVLGFGLGGNATIFMKVVLSDVPPEIAGSGTGTYGLFRDLAAPFGVAVLVPLFTNGITNYIDKGISEGMNEVIASGTAAVESMRDLAIIEVVCVCIGIVIVRMLPRVHNKGQ